MHHPIPGTNDLVLLATLDGKPCTHFTLREFQNPEGFAMLHRSLLLSLELVRRDLCAAADQDVQIVVTGALRTPADNERLAARLGWTDEGGAVSRLSRHLPTFGGIAVDLTARLTTSREPIPQRTLGSVCRRYFDWVKDDYTDGHVHADNRHRAD